MATNYIRKPVIFVTICVLMSDYVNSLPMEVLSTTSVTSEKTNADTPVVSLGFVHAFVASLSVIVVSELGDKTFFIAAIMAMRHSRITVFAGAISALALMTVLSVLFGYAATIIPRAYTYYISTALFAIFGLKMLREGFKMSANEGQDELEEVQADIRRKETEEIDVEQQATRQCRFRCGSKSLLFVSQTLLQAFTMTFLAEWGDRSQLATIILAARENAYGVALGGVLGHSFCTGLAVIGGRFIAQKISVRTVTIVGGVVFIMFALTALMFDPNEGET
ncbi:transmembrane protein 165 isoform X2 [Adelges cooleyi]|uniref:transmembrane protein 165 isoform X2 n=1 Tax=Adelges cooleyi TaxID=133065 RepID=UPI00217FCA6A|nr:transmembrane protein 165 isoform X2 [Adelges cooleyi]